MRSAPDGSRRLRGRPRGRLHGAVGLGRGGRCRRTRGLPFAEQLDFRGGAALILNLHGPPLLAEAARTARGGRAGARARRRGRGRDGHPPGGQGPGRVHRGGRGLERRRRMRAPPAPAGRALHDGRQREQVQELTEGGVDVVIDPVGEPLHGQPPRAAREAAWWSSDSPRGRSLRSRSTGCSQVTEVVRAGWGAYVMQAARGAAVAEALDRMIADRVVKPIVGERFPACRGRRGDARSRAAAPPARSCWTCPATSRRSSRAFLEGVTSVSEIGCRIGRSAAARRGCPPLVAGTRPRECSERPARSRSRANARDRRRRRRRNAIVIACMPRSQSRASGSRSLRWRRSPRAGAALPRGGRAR